MNERPASPARREPDASGEGGSAHGGVPRGEAGQLLPWISLEGVLDRYLRTDPDTIKLPDGDFYWLVAEIRRLREALRRTVSGVEPTDDVDLLRNWRDAVVARAAAAGMPAGEGLCDWFERLATP